MNNFIISMLSSSLVAAIFTGLLNIKNTNKTIHAQVVAKARHEWIQEVRNLVSEYMSEITHIKLSIDKELQDDNSKINLPTLNQAAKRLNDLEIHKYKIILHFGESKTYRDWKKLWKKTVITDETNKKYNKNYEDIEKNISEYIELAKKLQKNKKIESESIQDIQKKIELSILSLNKATSNYLKTEWYKTKKMK